MATGVFKRAVHLDFETYSETDIKSAGSFRYMEDPAFEILLLAYAFDDEPVKQVDFTAGETWPEDFLEALNDPEVTKIAHNAAFERYAIWKSLGHYCPPEEWFDTMHLVAQCGLPASLDGAGQALGFDSDTAKMKEGKALIRYFCQPCKPTKANGQRTRNLPEHATEKWEQFKEYSRQDVVAERALFDTLAPHWMPDEAERKFWALDARINENGVRIDTVLAANAVEMDKRSKEILTAQAVALTGMDNPKSVSQIKEWLYAQEGQEIVSLNKKAVVDVVANLKTDAAKQFMAIRTELSKSSTAKFEAMLRVTCPDGHAKGCFQFYGANRTGRFAGRHIQFQNMSKNEAPDISLARDLVRAGDYDGVELLFGSVPKMLSELVRTAVIPEDGHHLLVSDFSAIEARVIAWLAGEQWRIKVFEEGGDIYCQSASQMFKVPVEKHGVNGHLRQKGKIAELACGYGGGVNALKAFGADKMGLTNEEMVQIVDQWRAASPRITELWKSMERAAIRCIVHRYTTQCSVSGIRFQYEKGVLWMVLPSGRRLAYFKAEYGPSQWNKAKMTISYMGVNQQTKKWTRVETWGGKLVENCWAAGTLVLTDTGWVPIESVTPDMRIWDGEDWVQSKGRLERFSGGNLFEVDGLYVTGDHKILTSEGWRHAKECDGLDRVPVQLPDNYGNERQSGLPRKETLGGEMCLRKRTRHGYSGPAEKRKSRPRDFVRMQASRAHRRCDAKARDVKASRVWSLARYDSAVHGPKSPCMEKLWRARHHSLREMATQLRELLGGYGAYLRARFGFRPERQRLGVFTGKLPLGNENPKFAEQAPIEIRNSEWGGDSAQGNRRKNRDQLHDVVVPAGLRMSVRETDRCAGHEEPVYDILNCGPNSRYVVLGANGPIISHNCTQAVARDCLRESMFALDDAGYDIRATVHDEVIVTEPRDGRSVEEMSALMGQPISWAPGLPLRADGYACDFYIKD